MPTLKYSDVVNITNGPKIFTDEMIRDLPVGDLARLRKQGWDYLNPIAGLTWQEVFARGADKDGYRHKSPDFHEGMLLENQVPEGDTYIAGTMAKLPKQPEE